MSTLPRTTPLLLAAATLLAACPSERLIGYSPPDKGRISCASLGVRCGLVDDGDGGALDCGACPTDAGQPFLPPSMGDEFAVDQPVVGPDEAEHPDVAFDGRVHLVAWMNLRGVFAARFDRDGQRLDGEPIIVGPAELVLSAWCSVRVMPKEGGGFFVLWAGVYETLEGALYASDVGLWAVTIGTDGKPSAPRYLSAGFDLPPSFAIQALGTTENGIDTFRLVRAGGADRTTPDSVVIDTWSPYSGPCLGCGSGRVPMGEAVSAFSHAQVGDRDFVAAIVRDPSQPTGSAVVVKMLPVGWGGALGRTIDDAVEVLRASGVSARVVAVGDRAAVIWSSGFYSRSLHIATLRPTGPDSVESSQIVTLASATQGVYGVAAGIEGGNVIVAVRGVLVPASPTVGPNPPLAIVVDPQTLAQVGTIDGDASVLPNDGPLQSAISDFSWNGEKNLAVVTQSYSYPWGGAGGTWNHAAAVSTSSAQPFPALESDQYLPGGENAETSPRATCRREQCLIVWHAPNQAHEAQAVRASAVTGEVLDPDSFRLSNHCDALTATEKGFLCASVALTPAFEGRLSLQVVPTAGAPSEPVLYPMEEWWYRNFQEFQFEFARTDSALFLVAMLRNAVSRYTEDCRMYLFQIDPDGTAHPVSHTIPDGRYGTLAAMGIGEELVIALSEYSPADQAFLFATALVDPAASATRVNKSAPLPAWSSLVGPFLVESAIGPVLGWFEHGYVDSYSFRWATMDSTGVVGTPRTLLTERGEVGDVQVAFDGRGFAILYARRTFSTDPYEIVLRRFDPSDPAPQGSNEVRVVATGISTSGHALAGAGEGRWLAAYARYGIDPKYGTSAALGTAAPRVFGRFIYEASGCP